MNNQFRRRIYSGWGAFWSDVRLSLAYRKRARKSDPVSLAFRERLMLVVTEVTGTGVVMPVSWRMREPVTVISSTVVTCSWAMTASGDTLPRTTPAESMQIDFLRNPIETIPLKNDLSANDYQDT